jgi:excisionase family DNA binding protein
MEILFKIPSEQKAAFLREIKNALKEELEEIKAVANKEASHDEEYLNRQEACKFLRCSLATLYNYQKAGRIPFLKIGRKVLFKKSELILNMSDFKVKRIL